MLLLNQNKEGLYQLRKLNFQSKFFNSKQFQLFEKFKTLYNVPTDEKPISVNIDDHITSAIAHKSTPLSIAKFLNLKGSNFPLYAKVQYENQPGPHYLDLNRPLTGNCQLEFVDFKDDVGRHLFWHSSAHVLGAVLQLNYGVQLIHGPSFDRGFFYEFQQNNKDQVGKIDIDELNVKIKHFLKTPQQFERLDLSIRDTMELFEDMPYKKNTILKKNLKSYSVYRLGQFIDLCRGPHLLSTKPIKYLNINEHQQFNSKQSNDFERFYGVSFPSTQEKEEYEKFLQMVAENDHRILGKHQKLFAIHKLAPGSPIFLPHGAKIYHKLIEFMRKEQRKRGYQELITPNLYNQELWETSGHLEKYKENIYLIDDGDSNNKIGLKPMNCPGHCLVYSMHSHSYRDLPIRYSDFAVLHRNEVHGSLTGLTRVRRFVQDDAHIFCTQEQIQSEISNVLDLVKIVYNILGFEYSVSLSTKPELHLGNEQIWKTAELQLKNALSNSQMKYTIHEGHGAFYGPKIDFHLKDLLGRSHQCGTIQLDFNLPEKFQLKYRSNDEDQYSQPVMIHRAILGSLERMIAVLIEHTKGKWPFWLSPRQIIITNVSTSSKQYAEEIYKTLFEAEFNVELDISDHTLAKKIKLAQDLKFNYILVVGEQEKNDKLVDVRDRDLGKTIGKMTLQQFIDFAKIRNDPYYK